VSEMSNMNGNTRKKLYITCVQRNGNTCQKCGISDDKKQLIIDHIDNNNYNNSLENLQLLCRRCNYLKNPRRPFDECVSECSDFESSIKINQTKEHEFRQWAYEELDSKRSILKREFINRGAEVVKISPVTAKRYLDKMCSKAGILKICNGCVQFDEEHPLFRGLIDEYDGLRLRNTENQEQKTEN